MTIIGIDPSMSNTALVAMKDGKVIDRMLIETEPAKGKQVRVNSDTIARCRKIYGGAHDFVVRNNPDIVISEVPSGSQGNRAAVGYGVVCMLLAGMGYVMEVTPDEVKVAATGKKTASKKDMIEWAMDKHPELEWNYHKVKGKMVQTEAKNEHLADAVAVIYAGMKLPEFQRLIQFAV